MASVRQQIRQERARTPFHILHIHLSFGTLAITVVYSATGPVSRCGNRSAALSI